MQNEQQRQNTNSGATLVLASVAVLSVLLYLLAFVYPYNIFELYPYPQLAVYRFAQDNPLVIWRLTIAFVIQWGLYFLGWRAAQQARGSMAWLIVLGGALASGLVLLFLYPFDAADVFDNIMHGRILSVYGANPFRDVANQFPDDPFYAYAAWPHVPSFYGPGWELLAARITWLAGDGIIANVLAFKLVEGVFLATSIGLVFLILRRAAPERLLAGVTLLAWNPLILYETLGNAHNDIVIVFLMLTAVLALLYRRYTLAILALLLGGLFKFIPLLLLPAAGLMALRSLPDNRARLRFLVVTTLSAGLLIVLFYAPFWYGTEILNIMSRRSQFFTASLPAVVYTWLLPTLGKAQAAATVSLTATGATILFVLWQSWWAWRKPTWLTFSQVGVNILLFYLLLTCAWFQQWYALWPLALAVLLPPGLSVYLTLILAGYSLLAKHIIFGPLIYRLHPFPREWREIWFGPTVLGVPWLYAFFALIDSFARKVLGTGEVRN
jgi:alpha-1,6-mannosyltransferase